MELNYHEALTRPILAAHGFGLGAQAVVIAGNWATDIWTLGPLASTAQGRAVSRFHFLNLSTPEEIAAQWIWLEAHAAQTLAQLPSTYIALRELGQMLHCVQDFYAHTNWVELNLAAGATTVPLWEEGPVAGVSLDGLLSAYYPDRAAPRREVEHHRLHKDHPWCAAGPKTFDAALDAAHRATELWLPRFVRHMPTPMRAQVSRLPRFMYESFVLASVGWIDRLGLPRWIGGGPAPWSNPTSSL
ncbi:MAG: hypothetical protein H0T73_00355 [Ardenticatenales bacterium]|nr:hypothetical protein [Ardenticatenales bacterium]